ncbi:MAG: cation:proton antiporter [Phycisphaerales bacterium]|nr:cation:proton antiporter [Phycisphaerales bacterium]
MSIVLAAAGVVTLLFHRLKQPVVLGYIIAGTIIGPYVCSFVDDRHHTIEILSELGVMLLMFGLGLHFSIRKLVQVGITAFSGATLEILVMGLCGYILGRAFGWTVIDSIFLGAILSASSTTIIIKVFQELGLSKAMFASLVFGILIVEDIFSILLLVILSGVAAMSAASSTAITPMSIAIILGQLVVFLAVVMVFGLLSVPPLIRYVNRFKSDEMLLVVALALCFGVSLLAMKLGYSIALGAFLIGVVLAETREHGKIDLLVAPVRDMFAAIFFVSIGMLFNPQLLLKYPIEILIITIIVVVGKFIACGLGAFVVGNNTITSMRVGMSLAQIGEFSFLIAALGVQLKVTSEYVYPTVIAVSAVTALLTPYLIKSSDPITAWIERTAPPRLVAYLESYPRWISNLRRSGASSPQFRKLLIKWALQLGLNLLLITGILIAAAAFGKTNTIQNLKTPHWIGGPNTLVWFVGICLTLPLLIAMIRKMRAIAMALAEIAITRGAERGGERGGGEFQLTFRRALLANMLLAIGFILLSLWGLLLTSAILPSWPVLLCLIALIALVAAAMQRSFIRLYAKAQVQLAETLAPLPEAAHVDDTNAHSLAPLLANAQMYPVTLPPDTPAGGKLIRELELRTRTGATIVAIDRPDASMVNPGPDDELRPGDTVFLLGTTPQIAQASALLTGSGGDKVKG